MSSYHTMPDPELDVSGCLLASMELGIKSVSWDMVKKEITKDMEFQDLAFYLNTCQTWTDLVMMPHVRIPRCSAHSLILRTPLCAE